MIRSAPDPADTRLDHAISELAQLRSTDPAARHAMHAIKLTRSTLETFGAAKHRPSGGSNAGAEPGPDDESSESPR